MFIGRRILVIIGGSIAAYKVLDLIRKLREQKAHVQPIMTAAAAKFVTPMSVSTLAGVKVYRHLFDSDDEANMGHITLSRQADVIIVAPATANLIGKMAHGLTDDLASCVLLAADKPILLAPAMNVRMWQHPAVKRNLLQLSNDGVHICSPEQGAMACGEYGIGRMAEVKVIIKALNSIRPVGALSGRHIVVTSGATREPIDPVRYITNKSSGRQGVALAQALVTLGAQVLFITGPCLAPMPMGCQIIKVQTAAEMLKAVEAALPVDAAVFIAAVSDWRVANIAKQKLKKSPTRLSYQLDLVQNPDILALISGKKYNRPRLVIGFAAETEDIITQAMAKHKRKGCDWILANDVSASKGTIGGNDNAVHFISTDSVESWPLLSKIAVGQRLANKIAQALL